MEKYPIKFTNEVTEKIYCPKCKKMHEYTIPHELSIIFNNWNDAVVTSEDDFNEDYTFDISVKPMIACRKCGSMMINIDKKMAYSISILNISGYETMFCCEGHYDKASQSGTYPYIMLKMNENIKKYYDMYRPVKNLSDNDESETAISSRMAIPVIPILEENVSVKTDGSSEEVLVLSTSLGRIYSGDEESFNRNNALALDVIDDFVRHLHALYWQHDFPKSIEVR